MAYVGFFILQCITHHYVVVGFVVVFWEGCLVDSLSVDSLGIDSELPFLVFKLSVARTCVI